ncbi:hypothetical protein F442_16661 [Phytophthora nicotianae P10297]|uniref:Uncharacterized protein n=1 Tax=Phytophthora nicotianae P10297 TaxID=1317064 RepID=W2YKA1_PHYNI|nr:hypothetical protein F442_16661 [Phytophthora nicotianae P10297]
MNHTFPSRCSRDCASILPAQFGIRSASLTRDQLTLPKPIMKKPANSTRSIERGLWSGEEHDRFLDGLKLYPHGPWKKIATYVGTRSPRQVQTHAQKYYEKVGRRLRGLRKDRKKLVRPEHRLDEDMVQLCQLAKDRKDPNGHVDPTLASRLRAPLSSPSKISISVLAMESAEKQQNSFQGELQQASSFDPPSPCSSASTVSTDSDAGMDLSDFDDSCLDFLIEVLSDMDTTNSGESFVVNV